MKSNFASVKTIFAFVIAFAAFGLMQVSAQTSYTSKDNQSRVWSDVAAWTTTVPSTTIDNETVNIYGFVSENGSISTSGNGNSGNKGILHIYDTLWITGNLTNNGGEIIVEPGGILIVGGNVTMQNFTDMTNYGNVIIKGDLSVTDKSSVDNQPVGSNGFYVFGTTTESTNGNNTGFQGDAIKSQSDLGNDNPGLASFSQTNTVLPIVLVQFAAEVTGETVHVSWTTSMEESVASFSIERAGEDGVFTSIALIDATGNSAASINYSFIDNNPLNHMSLYRLKSTDVDGTVSYFPVVSVWYQAMEQPMNVYPNPVSDDNKLIVHVGNAAVRRVLVSDLRGNPVIETEISQNNSEIMIPQQLSPGAYMVSVIQENGRQHHIRLLKN